MKSHHLLWTIVLVLVAWFVWVHYVRGVPVKRK